MCRGAAEKRLFRAESEGDRHCPGRGGYDFQIAHRVADGVIHCGNAGRPGDLPIHNLPVRCDRNHDHRFRFAISQLSIGRLTEPGFHECFEFSKIFPVF